MKLFTRKRYQRVWDGGLGRWDVLCYITSDNENERNEPGLRAKWKGKFALNKVMK